MEKRVKLILALQQIDNISHLVAGNQYEGFVSSHLIPLKFEFERQLHLTNGQKTN
jgi:hypothetical protein